MLARRLIARFPEIDAKLFVIFATVCTAFVLGVFVEAMRGQTGGEWSAPLDDVFIHFDYARSTARGYPFEWSEGNGYSSGNTSILYPFVLALGYWVGFRGPLLMEWAVLVAAASMLVFFLGAARLVRPLGAYAKYVVPPAVLSVGALDWSLASGMENAFHLGVWGLAALALDRLERRARKRVGARLVRAAAWLGLVLVLLVWTRPESVVCVAAFAIRAAWVARRRKSLGTAALVLVASGVPAALGLGAQMLANRVFTGESAQAGALAKVSFYHPYWTAADVWADWQDLAKYIVTRLFHHHFSDAIPYGYLVLVVALVPFASSRMRGTALFLWAQILGWCALVAFNGQVRWQNERYVMSAVAWLFVLAAAGLAILVSRHGKTTVARVFWGGRVVLALAVAALYWKHEAPKMKDQIWFFARASRNIRDQQTTAGRELRQLDPPPRRVLVGDAGAIVYASDLGAVDLIGLGGYHDYPFARATRFGLGAGLELIERMPDRDRPDVMAIYPGWWGDLPIVFGEYETEVPVVGNVICGGPSKVIYRAHWAPLDRTGLPRGLDRDEDVVGEVDVADLMSERPASYVRPGHAGFVVWRVLGDPAKPERDLFDAGRIVPYGMKEAFDLDVPAANAVLVARTVATAAAEVRVRVDGREVGALVIAPSAGWIEPSLSLPDGLPARVRVELEPVKGEWVDYHVWAIGPK
ncbi:MAG TPA: hypothetical protein VL400_24520 [Polyangiaceae bacterium]|nr:hypothetical protein [Polyangiaceae bacterium]